MGIVNIEESQAGKVLAADAAFAIIDDVAFVRTGTNAARPAASKAGRVYLPTDVPVVYRDTGSVWEAFGPVHKLTDPNLQTWSWVAAGSATATTVGQTIFLKDVGHTAGRGLRFRQMTAPATPYTVTACLLGHNLWTKAALRFGIGFRQSSDGKLHVLSCEQGLVNSDKYTTETAFSATYESRGAVEYPRWIRMTDDGTNRVFSTSGDSNNWISWASIGRTDFLTADRIGFWADAENAATPNYDCGVTLMSWAIT